MLCLLVGRNPCNSSVEKRDNNASLHELNWSLKVPLQYLSLIALIDRSVTSLMLHHPKAKTTSR